LDILFIAREGLEERGKPLAQEDAWRIARMLEKAQDLTAPPGPRFTAFKDRDSRKGG
jgi:hypothetical protein